jgi:RNA polymerase sigma factor (sigma-70 family)
VRALEEDSLIPIDVADRDLIRRCREGNSGAWHQVLNKYEGLVYSIPLRYGLSRHDAADIAQLTFTILVQSLDSLPEDSRLGAWLATVARRHSWRLMERNRRERPDERLEGMELAHSAAVVLGKNSSEESGESIEHWELSEWLEGALSKLGEPCRELLVALYFQPERPSYAEVARRLGRPVGSIGPSRARCLKRLRRILDGE